MEGGGGGVGGGGGQDGEGRPRGERVRRGTWDGGRETQHAVGRPDLGDDVPPTLLLRKRRFFVMILNSVKLCFCLPVIVACT